MVNIGKQHAVVERLIGDMDSMQHYILEPLADNPSIIVVLRHNGIDCMAEDYDEEEALKNSVPIEIGRLQACDLSMRVGNTETFHCLNDHVSGGKYDGLFCGDDFLTFLRNYEDELQRQSRSSTS